MQEIKGNLWEQYDADALVITTNGTVKKNGAAVMGRGCAFEAKKILHGVDYHVGELIARSGNHVFVLGHYINDTPRHIRDATIYTFPVKHSWREQADLELIARSAEELVARTSHKSKIVLPRPGCGNGHRDWETEVRPLLQPVLDDRFFVISF